MEELLHIKLGLEERSEILFKDLLKRNEYDPLDQLFKRMSDDSLKISCLKKQLLSANDEIRELRKLKLKFNSCQSEYGKNEHIDVKSKEPRNSSLPHHHKKDIESVEEKKMNVSSMKKKYQDQVENYIIFLLKCIREISRIPQEKRQNFEELVKKFQSALNQEKEKVADLSFQNNKLINQKSNLSSRILNPSEDNAVKLAKFITKADPEKTFEKVSEILGFKEMWITYISKLKSESKLYYELLDITKQEADKVEIPLYLESKGKFHLDNISGIFGESNKNNNSKSTGPFANVNYPFTFNLSEGEKSKPSLFSGFTAGSTSSLFSQFGQNLFGGKTSLFSEKEPNRSIFNKNSTSKTPFTEEKSNNETKSSINASEIEGKISWAEEIKKFQQKANENFIKLQSETIFNSAYQKKKEEVEVIPEKASELIFETVIFFFEKLDSLLVKHNQNPYQETIKPDFLSFQENLKALIKLGDWTKSKTIINNEINRLFRHIERRTKFYSNNRFFLRGEVN